LTVGLLACMASRPYLPLCSGSAPLKRPNDISSPILLGDSCSKCGATQHPVQCRHVYNRSVHLTCSHAFPIQRISAGPLPCASRSTPTRLPDTKWFRNYQGLRCRRYSLSSDGIGCWHTSWTALFK
jgi:hypothetical protein